MKRLLLITSVKESEDKKITYYDRFRREAEDDSPMCPLLADYLIHYLAVDDRPYAQRRDPEFSEYVDRMLPSDLYQRVRNKIESFAPDYIIVHVGIAFQVNRKLLLDVIDRIVRDHPQILCGIETRAYVVGHFHSTPEIRAVEDLLFRQADQVSPFKSTRSD